MPDEIALLLQRKLEIDRHNERGPVTLSYDRWMAEALAVLLRIASEEKARQRAS